MTMDTEKELIDKLKSSKASEIYNTLVKIRKTYVRNHDKMKTLQKYSVIELIIPLIEHPKFCSISLSIIADGCLELSFTNEVIKCNGPKALTRIMKSCVNDDVKNRACRALGNIAKTEVGFKAVLLTKPVSTIVMFLAESTDVNSQQTAVRTLMILGRSLKERELIVQENGLVYIAKLLCSSNLQLQICSVKAIANLTQKCSLSCAQQLLELEFLKVLVELNSHSEMAIRNHALISLKNLCSLEDIRTGLIKVGAVKVFTEILATCESHEMSRYAALALCRCLDHIHMWSHNGTDRSVGLKALLDVLKNKHLHDIHISVLAGLIPLSYEFNATDTLLNLDVLQILIKMLESFVKKYECKAMCHFFDTRIKYKDPFSSHNQLTDGSESDCINKTSCQKLSECDLSNVRKNFDGFEDVFKNFVTPEKSPDVYYLHKDVHKWDTSIYGFSSVTSDYSGSCSPSGPCSPAQKYSPSPEFNCDIDVGSPSTGHTSSGIWSPASQIDESMPYNVNCWSPVVSTHSNSPVREDMECGDSEANVKDEFCLFENSNFELLDGNTPENELEISLSNNLSFKSDETFEEVKTVRKSIKRNNYSDDSHTMISCKKFKKEILNVDDPLELQIETEMTTKPTETIAINNESKTVCANNTLESDKTKIESVCCASSAFMLEDNEQPLDFKSLNEKVDRQSIDRYIILFILQISFHIEKKTFQISENSFFSVLIDYIYLTHKPSSKAQTVLLNLIKNRHCLEKLILNGFFLELEAKMVNLNLPCYYHDDVYNWHSCLKKVYLEEIQSDFGIGALTHILLTSDRRGQFHAICTSKFVTNKKSLYKLLVEANGLSIMLDFLSDPDDSIRMRTVLSMVSIHGSLATPKKKPYKIVEKSEKVSSRCCFRRTCKMETSANCFYKESFLNVTFVVAGGAKILANREKICENSDYFRALLQGHFQESSCEVVVLRDISAENLSTIFHFLHGCGSKICCPYITRIPFSVLLELLSDCERFLLLKIKEFVEDRLCHYILSPSNTPKIYKQCKLHNSPALAKRILNETMKLTASQKTFTWSIFKELLDVGSSVNISSDIEEMFKSLLMQPS